MRVFRTVDNGLETVREDEVVGGAGRLAVGLAVDCALSERVAICRASVVSAGKSVGNALK